MIRNFKYRMDSSETIRRVKRAFDGPISYRRIFFVLLFLTILILYIGPSVLRWMFSAPEAPRGSFSLKF